MSPTLPKLVTLEAWVELTYGTAVQIDTARRWCREGRIYPAPEKHGRSYFVSRDARYTPPKPSLIQRLHASSLA